MIKYHGTQSSSWLDIFYNNIVTGFNQASSSFTSTAVAKETPTSHEIPQIQVAVCLQRLPIITREKIELEKHYTELQEQLEFEHSSLSDYEINKINMKNLREKLKHDEDNDELKKEIAMSESEYQVRKDYPSIS